MKRRQQKKAGITKSKRLKVGATGLLYCNETHSFTTPFLVFSEPDQVREVTGVWPEKRRLPFKIHPLGSPAKQLSAEAAKVQWPMLKDVGQGGVSAAMNITGTTVFVPTEVSTDDWALILSALASV